MKYFLNKKGVPTMRMAGKPGTGHVEIAKAFLGDLKPGGDVYEQMFALGFARVQEEADIVLVDAPRLTKGQQRFLAGKRKAGKRVSINESSFVKTRRPTSLKAGE